MGILKALLIIGLGLYLTLAAIGWFLSDRMIFLPPASSYRAGQLPVVLVPTGDGAEIATLHLPNPEARYTILFSHGNAEDLGYLAGYLEALRRAGFAVLAYDYRGYGLSTGGPPGADAAYRDQAAAYRYATGRLGIDPSRLVLHGRSLGTGPAVELAAREPVAGLVIESGFASAFRVMTRVSLLPFDKFPNERTLRRVRCPVLVIHGTRDRVIPPSHARLLFAAAGEPKRMLWVEGAGHNDLVLVAGTRYWEALRGFAQRLQSRGPAPAG